MATVTSYDGFPYTFDELNLHHLQFARYYTETATHFGAHYRAGDSDVFTGHGLTYSADGYLTGGTITGYTGTMDGDTVVTATGLDISARALEAAIDTRSVADDYRLFAKALDGNDTIVGSTGNNQLRGYAGNDVIKAGAGFDSVWGGLGNDTISGNGGNDRLAGNAGDDVLAGGLGHNVLIGGGGDDTFVFDLALGARSENDILDFTQGADHVELKPGQFNLPATNGVLDASAFHIGTHATTADQRIVYDARNGDLFFDQDGNGAHAAIRIGTLDSHLHLTAADFLVA